MLELYFEHPRVLRCLRSGVLGGEMDGIAAYFSNVGYRRLSAKHCISRLARFSAFALRHGKTVTIDQDLIDRLVRR